jgi:hypothetical protein
VTRIAHHPIAIAGPNARSLLAVAEYIGPGSQVASLNNSTNLQKYPQNQLEFDEIVRRVDGQRKSSAVAQQAAALSVNR